MPPRLVPPEDGRLDVLDAAGRAEAGTQWLRWWRALVMAEARLCDPAGSWAQDDLRGLREATRGIWPDDTGRIADLGPGDQAALQRAVSAAFANGCQWHARRFSPEDADRACFEWRLVRDAAEEVIRRHRVSPDAVRGYAVVLGVDGAWRALVGPGACACSLASAQDPQAARTVLLEVFESSLAPPGGQAGD